MRKSIFIAACALALVVSGAFAEEHHKVQANAIFDAMKPLAGTWKANVGGREVTTVYRVTSGGSAILENLMPETENMINMIHPDGDGVMFTHYCAGANQPRYRATKLDGNKIVFTFLDGTNLGDSYMNGVTLTMIDKDHLTQEWTSVDKGKTESFKFEFVRAK